MAKIPFDESELDVRGEYGSVGTWYGYDYPPVQKLNSPISPAENFRRYMAGEDYEWIPDLCSDMIEITPACNPDVDASDFTGGYDVFGVKWIPVPGGQVPAFVEPGFVVLDDVTQWEKLPWPDVDAWDWAACAAECNAGYAGDDRVRRGVLLSGYFERLIAVMGFEEAAIAMIEEPEAVSAFFEKLTDMNIQILDHMIDDFGCTTIKMHDDWSSQKAPFYSLATCREVIVPHFRRLVAHAHARGVTFTHHSCGNGVGLIPAMQDIGSDAWNAQYTAIDLDAAEEKANAHPILEISYDLPAELRGEALFKTIYDVMSRYCRGRRCLIKFSDPEPERAFESRKLIYKASRMIALEEV